MSFLAATSGALSLFLGCPALSHNLVLLREEGDADGVLDGLVGVHRSDASHPDVGHRLLAAERHRHREKVRRGAACREDRAACQTAGQSKLGPTGL